MTFGAVGGGDEAGVQDAGEGGAFGGHGFDGGAHDGVDGGVDDVLADLGNGAVGAHAAGVGSFVVIVGALVVLGDGHGPEFGAADEAHEGEFLAFEEIFDNDLGAGLAEAVVDEDVVESGDGGVDVHGDGDALAGGESVGLDDDRGAVFAHVGAASSRLSKVRYWAVGMLWRAISCLAKSLEPSIWAAALLGPNALMPARRNRRRGLRSAGLPGRRTPSHNHCSSRIR